MPRRALIAGLGLIGGSVGMALRARGWHVGYLDPYVDAAGAIAAGAADERREMIRQDGSDEVVILATPIDVALRLIGSGPAGVITSVCSVMAPLRAAANGIRFVAGHPMAGSERRGLGAARADLFAGRKWFVDADDDDVDAVIAACGAEKVRVDVHEHDNAMALVSHLPQVLSTALAASIDGQDTFAGSGLATFLRLAGSEASVWQPILEANRENIRTHFERVVTIARDLIEGKGDVAALFERAQKLVERTATSDQRPAK
jgi:prephenate dehydrogenase